MSTAVPVVPGTAAVGSALSAGSGTWTGTPTNYAYTWYSCPAAAGDSCSTVVGDDSSTFSPTLSDVGNTIHVCVTATNSYGHGTSRLLAGYEYGPGTGTDRRLGCHQPDAGAPADPAPGAHPGPNAPGRNDACADRTVST